jgi:predicted double-glycine peptidase
MRQEHVVIQNFDLSCGAAALATLLNYQYGEPVSERDVAKGLVRREEYLQNPDLVKIRQGFSLLDLKRYVEQRGYEGIGYGKLTVESLIEWAPVMVPINADGYNHFVIFRGVWGNRVLLADPAWGNRTMPVEEFEAMWVDYPDFGRVGFVVKGSEDGDVAPNFLAPRPEEFLSLK